MLAFCRGIKGMLQEYCNFYGMVQCNGQMLPIAVMLRRNFLRYVHTMPCGTQWPSVARPRDKSCAMPQVYVDVASA